MKRVCRICPHACILEEGQIGLCGARKNIKDRIIDDNYGQITAIALDPIEKKPLRRFFPWQQSPFRGQLWLQPSLPFLPKQFYFCARE